MSRDDSAYWEERLKKLYAQVETEEAKLSKQLSRYYQAEAEKLSREIASYYQKYGADNVLEYRKMLLGLSESDRHLLFSQMDEFARRYPQYAKLMPVRESIYKLDQMEALHESMRLQQLEIGAREIELIEPLLKSDALKAANFIAEQMGFGTNFYTVNANAVMLTVGAKWADGMDFSDRIWANKQKLTDYLHNEFAQGLARGVNYDTLERQLREKFADRSRYETMRVVRTEGTFVLAEAQAQGFMGIYGKDDAAYSLSTIPDNKACAICKEIEAETITNPVLISEREPGINYPPVHPNCRCSIQFALGDREDYTEGIKETARAAREWFEENIGDF